MFMEATSSHGFDADQAKSRRAYGVRKTGRSYSERGLVREAILASTSRPRMERMAESTVDAYPVTGSSGYMFARDNPRKKKTKHCLSS